ncbi:enoyl-CoA hydratase [Ottowia sp. VDI28]|uniref:enoyl-CoA hydratase n=1 Tax=Ottowia sp. VDI28 TaxID=3133968 RepID=UPI003C2BB500
MATVDLLETSQEGIVTLTFNRPAKRNAISLDMLAALAETLNRHALDPLTRVLILTGAGDAFCGGGDVSSMRNRSDMPPTELAESLTQRQLAFRRLQTFPKPVIARIRGAAVGAGFSMALACDFRIASRTARFGTAFTRIGLSGDNGIAWLLSKLVGSAKARELLMLGDILDARTALAAGLITSLVEEDSLDAETDRFARRLANGPTVAFGCIKRNLQAAEHLGLMEAMGIESMNQANCMHTSDHKEGMAAFLEHRLPEFKGK